MTKWVRIESFQVKNNTNRQGIYITTYTAFGLLLVTPKYS